MRDPLKIFCLRILPVLILMSCSDDAGVIVDSKYLVEKDAEYVQVAIDIVEELSELELNESRVTIYAVERETFENNKYCDFDNEKVLGCHTKGTIVFVSDYVEASPLWACQVVGHELMHAILWMNGKNPEPDHRTVEYWNVQSYLEACSDRLLLSPKQELF